MTYSFNVRKRKVVTHRVGRKRKGQVATEFIMTYGWALSVLFIVMGILVYYGLFDTSQVVENTCDIRGGFSCLHHQLLVNGGLSLVIGNTLDSSVYVQAITIKDKEGYLPVCLFKGDGESFTPVLLPGDEKTMLISCEPDSSFVKGAVIYGTIELSYFHNASKFSHVAYGEFVATAEP